MKRFLGFALILVIAVPVILRALDGDLDTTFGSGGIVITDFGGYDYATALALQSDGKIVAAGDAWSQVDGGPSNFALARYNSDGSLDTTFGNGGKVTSLLSFGATSFGAPARWKDFSGRIARWGGRLRAGPVQQRWVAGHDLWFWRHGRPNISVGFFCRIGAPA
jgi:uncharacterized delta-60 repeat protein